GHERRADPDVRVPRALLEPGLRDQGVRDRARGGDHLRRDRDPGAARAGADAPARAGELVAAALDAAGAVHPRRAAARGGLRSLGGGSRRRRRREPATPAPRSWRERVTRRPLPWACPGWVGVWDGFGTTCRLRRVRRAVHAPGGAVPRRRPSTM